MDAEDLGNLYVDVNIPEFMVRVVKDGEVIHEERIVPGRDQTQTPIFSSPMRTIVSSPAGTCRTSSRSKSFLPGLRAGGDPLRRQGLVMERNGRRIDAWDVDWYRADIRNFAFISHRAAAMRLASSNSCSRTGMRSICTTRRTRACSTNAFGCSATAACACETPSSSRKSCSKRTRAGTRARSTSSSPNGPEENEITLTQPIPVHITYFTAWVGKDGEVQTFSDVYGHEKRITLALQGRWNEIEKNDEKVVSPEDVPVASGWDDDGYYRRSRRDDD